MNAKELLAMLEKYPELADTLEKAYAKAEAKAKADRIRKEIEPLRVAAQTVIAKNFEPGWEGKIVIDFDGSAISPIVTVAQRFERDHKTSYRRVFTTVTRNSIGKRGGAVRVIKEDHELFGQEFANTGELADALGLPENEHGPYNALRSAGYNKNEFWAYVADLEPQPKGKAN